MGEQSLSIRQIMNRIYQDICGFEISNADKALVRSSKGSPVYGEINHEALNKLLNNLKLTKKDVFYDLGSGVGKVVLQTALASEVKHAIGVELSETRHQDALLALTKAKEFQASISRRCSFINADFLNVDLSKATVIYTCSTAFSMSFMKSLMKRLAQFQQDFRLITIQDLPDNGPFKLIDKIRLDMSWIRKTPVYIYSREKEAPKSRFTEIKKAKKIA